MKKTILLLFGAALSAACCTCPADDDAALHPSEYVSTLVGTQSEYLLSAGNTYPAVALPWGMNFWTPQTGKMGDGWAYTYNAHTLRGFKQTHQPSPWINDYGQFSLMPVRGEAFDEESRQSWFSHQREEARPYYYSVYLADHDIRTEITPTERAAVLRFTFPESDASAVVIDAFDRGSALRIIDGQTVAGVSTRNSGGVPDNFANYFVVRFSKPFLSAEALLDGRLSEAAAGTRIQGNHSQLKLHFDTVRGEQITACAASSFISEEQAFLNLKEVGDGDFERVKAQARERWDEILGRIEVSGGSEDREHVN